ncbi:hypothetical protein chiPu_0001370 [Chiloscyllium punctatum]|uniref:Uncharacterized protein n=1 Tax=Chiloscyllium punctatum TaxID=137246 RepID=A0A401RY00_CHIPU|nr:hypothetical protein [Chiloscyllium punctatum]
MLRILCHPKPVMLLILFGIRDPPHHVLVGSSTLRATSLGFTWDIDKLGAGLACRARLNRLVGAEAVQLSRSPLMVRPLSGMSALARDGLGTLGKWRMPVVSTFERGSRFPSSVAGAGPQPLIEKQAPVGSVHVKRNLFRACGERRRLRTVARLGKGGQSHSAGKTNEKERQTAPVTSIHSAQLLTQRDPTGSKQDSSEKREGEKEKKIANIATGIIGTPRNIAFQLPFIHYVKERSHQLGFLISGEEEGEREKGRCSFLLTAFIPFENCHRNSAHLQSKDPIDFPCDCIKPKESIMTRLLVSSFVLSATITLRIMSSFASTENSEEITTEPSSIKTAQQKIMDARYKCYDKMAKDPSFDKRGLYCNRTWDGWLCWDDTPAGTLSMQNCPNHFNDFDETEKATKYCDETGDWFKHPETNRTWSNYTLCTKFIGYKGKVNTSSIASTENYDEITTEPSSVETAEDLIMQKIMDAQFKCYEKMVRDPLYDKPEKATKYCDETGNWFKHPETNRTWSNYTFCNKFTDYKIKMARILYYMAVVGHTLSIISLLISLAIFFYFKSLSCQRITLHKNLFVSYVFNSIFTLIQLMVVANDKEVVSQNPVSTDKI